MHFDYGFICFLSLFGGRVCQNNYGATREKYEFEKPSGRYNVIPHLLTGTLNGGRKFFLDLADENIQEIRISIGQTISRVDLAGNPDQAIFEIMVDGNIYTSDQNEG